MMNGKEYIESIKKMDFDVYIDGGLPNGERPRSL